MQQYKPSLAVTQRAARCTICPHCPLHWGPDRKTVDDTNPCELQCDLFHHLPAIKDAAACADPMIRPVEAAAAGEIALRAPLSGKRTSPLWRNRKRLIGLLRHLFGG